MSFAWGYSTRVVTLMYSATKLRFRLRSASRPFLPMAINSIFCCERSQQKIELIAIGKKGRDALRKRNRSFVAEYINVTTRVEYPQAKDIAQKVIELYSSGETDAVYAVYNELKNVMTQKLTVEKLLPIEPESFQPEAAEKAHP